MNSIFEIILKIPEGYSEGVFNTLKYGITKQTFNNVKSFKVYAEELRGKDFISLNFYCTSDKFILKPCEMPEEKVIQFLQNVAIQKS